MVFDFESFQSRHIGPDPEETADMLKVVGAASLDALMDEAIPARIRLKAPLNLPDGHGANDTLHPQMRDARATVLAACKKNKVGFLNTVRPNDVEEMLKEGVMVGSGGQEAADKGRKFTKRQMPW